MCTTASVAVAVRSSAAAAPTTKVTGGGSGAGSAASVPRRTCCAARLAALIAAIGVSGRAAAGDQRGRDPPDPPAAGEDHERPAEPGERLPVGRLAVLGVVVAVDERRGHAELAQHQRDAGRGGRGQRGRHAGDDVAPSMPASRSATRLLAAARGDERVAALEPHDVAVRAAELDQQRVDLGLGQRPPPGRAARRSAARPPAGASATIASSDGRS